jgi:hypothetical protein
MRRVWKDLPENVPDLLECLGNEHEIDSLKHIARYVDDLEDQLEYMKDIGVAVHKYVTGYSRMRVALLILAGDTPLSDKIDTLDLAKRFAAEAVKFADEDCGQTIA